MRRSMPNDARMSRKNEMLENQHKLGAKSSLSCTNPSPTLATRLPNQVASDENQYLRRRLEAFERTALKLNLPGSKGGSQGVNENLEPSEIARLRDTAHALEADKVALSQVRSFVFSLALVSRGELLDTEAKSKHRCFPLASE